MRASLIASASIAAAFALASAAPTPARAEDVADRATPGVRVFDDKDGLPQNTISSQTMDAEGRLWVGTQEGLAVYDGVSIRRVPLPEERRSEWITALAVTADGTLATGTHGDGVWLRKNGVFTHVSAGLPDDSVRSLAWIPLAGGGGELWAGTRKGVARLGGGQPQPWQRVAGDPFADKLVSTVVPGDAPGEVWVGSEAGVARLAGGAWTTWGPGDAGLPPGTVGQILVEKGGAAVWASSRAAGIARFDGARWTATKLACDDVLPLAETRASHPNGPVTLWAGTNCAGLVRIDGDRQFVIDKKTSDLPSDFLVTLSVTRPDQGPPALWVGTDGGGLARVLLGGWRSLTSRSSAIDSPVYAFGWSRADDGAPLAWIGTQTGLLRFDGHAWSSVPLPEIASGDQYTNQVLDAQGAGERGLWVASFGGVSRLLNGAWTTFTPHNSRLPAAVALTLLEAHGEHGLELLAGMRNGLARFSGGAWAPVDEPGAPTKNEVTSLTETTAADGSPVLWAATSDGGIFARDHGAWTQYSMASSPLPGDEVLQVRSIATAAGERLFVSTGEAGLLWFDPRAPKGTWSRLTTKTSPALPDNCVYGVVSDRAGRLYACTNHGVARLAPRAGADGAYDVQVSRTEDGLPSEECNTGGLAVDPKGRVWVGTLKGAAVLDPDEERDDRMPKRLLLRETHLFEDPVDLARRPALKHDESTLTFDFALVSYHREAETRYRTQLVGLERAPSSWTSDAKVRFTSLPAGSYELRVWGRDYAGVESGPLVVPFRIDPAPWRTWWAYGAYVLVGGALVASSVRLREAALRKRARELEEGIATRTKELAATVKELDRKNQALVESHQRADRIFSALADVLPGSVLDGKYRIGDKIGSGGFGAVFRGEQIALGRSVAVKIFRPSAGNDSALALERFQREGMSACRVNHPNAIQVFDSGISGDGIPYLVMELLDGRSLRSELRSFGSLPLGRALTIATHVCEALAAAHAASIIHRDIKPDNVFLQKGGEGPSGGGGGGEIVKILDFGIAKLLDGDDALPDATASAALLGTPRYMAPERLARTRNDDARGDVYSVGVTLFEMIAGRSPWPKSQDIFKLVTNILTGTPRSLTTYGVPERVDAIVRSALAREPEDRPTAAALAEQLTEARAALSPDELAQAYGTPDIDANARTLDAADDTGSPGTGSVEGGLTKESDRELD